MHVGKYFNRAFEKNDKMVLSQSCYFSGVEEKKFVSYEKNKNFEAIKKKQ